MLIVDTGPLVDEAQDLGLLSCPLKGRILPREGMLPFPSIRSEVFSIFTPQNPFMKVEQSRRILLKGHAPIMPESPILQIADDDPQQVEEGLLPAPKYRAASSIRFRQVEELAADGVVLGVMLLGNLRNLVLELVLHAHMLLEAAGLV